MEQPTHRVVVQKFTLLLASLSVFACVTGGWALVESEDFASASIALAVLTLGALLAAYDVRRRLRRLRLGVSAHGQVSWQERGEAPRECAWGELMRFEPGCLSSILLLKVAMAVGALAGRELGVTGALFACLSLGLFSELGARLWWVKLRFPGRRAAALFSYRGLESLGVLEALKASQAGVPLDARVVDTTRSKTTGPCRWRRLSWEVAGRCLRLRAIMSLSRWPVCRVRDNA